MEIAIQALLAIVQALLPDLGVASTNVIAKIVDALVQLEPVIAKAVPALIQEVQGVIASLQSSGALTADQMTALTTLNASVDAALAAAIAADPDLQDPVVVGTGAAGVNSVGDAPSSV